MKEELRKMGRGKIKNGLQYHATQYWPYLEDMPDKQGSDIISIAF